MLTALVGVMNHAPRRPALRDRHVQGGEHEVALPKRAECSERRPFILLQSASGAWDGSPASAQAGVTVALRRSAAAPPWLPRPYPGISTTTYSPSRVTG